MTEPNRSLRIPRDPADGAENGGGGNRTRVLIPTESCDLQEEEVGYRLAALADGEGCFYIGRINRHKSGGGTYTCAFKVKMRADDRPFLERMAQRVGLGRLNFQTEVTQDGHDRKPSAIWVINTKAECMALVGILDTYPLWSKKARDYDIWREAVIYWNWPSSQGGRIDWTPMEEYRIRLRECREYLQPLAQEVRHG